MDFEPMTAEGKRSRGARDPAEWCGPVNSPSPSRPRARFWWLCAAIFAVALAMRVAHVLAMRDTSFVQHPSIDPGAYDARSREILAGKWFPDDVFFQDPLYPYLLAGMYTITGGAKLGPYFVHAVISAISCVLFYIVGKRYISERAGIFAGVIAALYAPFLFLDGQLEKNTLTILTLMSTLALLARPASMSAGRIFAAGFMLGCGALVRGNFLLVIPAISLILLFEPDLGAIARRVKFAILFGIAALVPFSPFTYHNWRVSGDFILTTAQAGTAFYLGNNPENVSGGIHAISFNRQVPEFEADDWKREAERRCGRALSRREVSSYWFGAATSHITKDPGFKWWLSLILKKAELIVNDYEVPDNTAMRYVERLSPALGLNRVRFGTVAPFGLVGVLLLLIGWHTRKPIFVAFGIYGATMLLFPVSDRFRAPVAALMILGAGATFDALITNITKRNFIKILMFAGGISGAAILVNHDPWLQPENTNIRPQNALLKAYHDDAGAWINAKQWDRAEAVLNEAMKDEWLAKKARLNLDLAMVRWHGHQDAQGASDLARKSISNMLKEGIQVPDGYLLYSQILQAQGKPDVAAYWLGRMDAANAAQWNEIPQMAKNALAKGDDARATGLLDEFVFVDQRGAQALNTDVYEMLARLQLANGQRDRARETISKLIKRGGAAPADLEELLK